MRIAVDAMGGDQAPLATVHGALRFAERSRTARIFLVGEPAGLRAEIDRARAPEDLLRRIEVVTAMETVGKGEAPVEAVRRRKDTSIRKAAELVRDGEADALVSAGDTGATVAAATLLWKTLEGVRRPGIAATLPTMGEVSVIIDVGANIQCKPSHLLQYGVMASAFYESMYDNPSPKVGLLNIGEEDRKGNELVRQTGGLFRESTLPFVGNVEGQELYKGDCQVFVCEGFVGNMILKVSEGVGVGYLGVMKQKLKGGGKGRLLGPVAKWLFRRLMRDMRGVVDYAAYGGAPLLGVDGVCIIAHGRSDANAMSNALGVAGRFQEKDINGRIVDRIRTGAEVGQQG
jgi:glycerol-3-phosphate acyltransferase PlsX